MKWVQSWRAEGQTGSGEQGQAMSPRGRKSCPRRSSIFGAPVRKHALGYCLCWCRYCCWFCSALTLESSPRQTSPRQSHARGRSQYSSSLFFLFFFLHFFIVKTVSSLFRFWGWFCLADQVVVVVERCLFPRVCSEDQIVVVERSKTPLLPPPPTYISISITRTAVQLLSICHDCSRSKHPLCFDDRKKLRR